MEGWGKEEREGVVCKKRDGQSHRRQMEVKKEVKERKMERERKGAD